MAINIALKQPELFHVNWIIGPKLNSPFHLAHRHLEEELYDMSGLAIKNCPDTTLQKLEKRPNHRALNLSHHMPLAESQGQNSHSWLFPLYDWISSHLGLCSQGKKGHRVWILQLRLPQSRAFCFDLCINGYPIAIIVILVKNNESLLLKS